MVLKRRGIIAENLLQLFIKAKAESSEGDNTNTDNNGEDTNTNNGVEENPVNLEDVIAQVRKEEKDKLYPQINGYKKQVDNLTALHNKTLLENASKEKTIEELKGKLEAIQTSKATPEDIEKITTRNRELEIEVETLKSNQVDVEALTNKINSTWEVKLYREQKLREVGNTVIPELVNGDTKEDIDASIVASQQRFNELLQNVNNGATTSLPSGNISTSKYSLKEVNPSDIRDMSPQEWAERRKSFGLK